MESAPNLPKQWIREQKLLGDASSRLYARLWDSDEHTAILTSYPPCVRDQISRDLEVRAWCEAHGFRVPALLDLDLDQGWAVLEDFGLSDGESTLEAAPPDDRRTLGERFIAPLATFARLTPSRLPQWNPPLGGARLRWELAGFELWFLRHLLDVAPIRAIGRWLDELAADIDRHPQRVCHRDYHLNNLFLLADGTVGLIDYQDILVGPDTYDAVSLLGERGMPRLLPAPERTHIQTAWARNTDAAPGWLERWQSVRAQRSLKVLGTFARLTAGGSEAYGPWMDDLAGHLGAELAELEAPSELVDLLLDLSRRRHPASDGCGHETAPT